MKWAPTRNAAPASSDLLRANLAKEEATLASLESEQPEIEEALPGLVPEPDRYVEAQARLREIEVLLPPKRRTVEAIREAIPAAEAREERERFRTRVAEHERKSAKLGRDLKARYSKAAEAFAEMLRDIKADEDEWRNIRAVASGMREPISGHSAQWSLRLESRPNNGGSSWMGSVTDDVVVRTLDGRVLFG